MYGKRRLLLVSLGAFAIGSLVCALAGSIEVLIAGRVIQGTGAAVGPLGIGLVRDHSRRERAPVAIGLLVAGAGAGAAVGLVLSGLLVDSLSVSAVFWFLFGLAAALMLGVRLLVAEGAVPLLDLKQMDLRAVWSANLAAFAMGFALFIAGVVVPQIATLPEASGYGFELTVTQTGLILLPSALAIVVGGFLSGRLAGRVGARLLVAYGAVCAASGYLLLALLHGSLAWIAVANGVLGLGLGLAFAAIANLVVRSVGERQTSVSVAANAIVRTTGAALGAQMAAAVVISAGVAPSGTVAISSRAGDLVPPELHGAGPSSAA